MDARISFVARCPNGHMPTQDFDATLLRERVEAGRLQLSCVICDTHWLATPREIANARKLLSR